MHPLIKVKNNKGYTIPTALAIMFLLMAFAVGIMLVSYYNYMNSFVRHQQNQTYVYAKTIVEECTNAIIQGDLNKSLSDAVVDIHSETAAGNQFAKEYNFTLNLGTNAITGEKNFITNEFNNENIDIILKVKYIPQRSGIVVPAAKDVLQIGDRMKIEYTVVKTDHRDGQEIRNTFIGDYFCSRDKNINEDGTMTTPQLPEFENIEWQLVRYTGNIYAR